MADSRLKQLRAHQATAKDCYDRLPHAATKAEAFDLVLKSAESLMAARSLADSAEEKEAIRQRCQQFMDLAERIKNSTTWPLATLPNHNHASSSPMTATLLPPLPTQQSLRQRPTPSPPTLAPPAANTTPSSAVIPNARTSDRATDPVAAREDDNPASFAHSPFTSSSTPPHASARAVPQPLPIRPRNENVPRDARIPSAANTGRKNETASGSLAGLATSSGSVTKSDSPAAARYPVHRLAQPVSTRKHSTKEEIIFLKASFYNDLKFPPWKDEPASPEFALEAGATPYIDECDLNLSPYQQQFFKAWERPQHALPPSSHRAAGQPEPVMESEGILDLVQDAATDCSVVASLCAAVARAERGHDQMLTGLIFPQDRRRGVPVFSSNGKYIVRLNFNGGWRRVIIDDRLPLSNTHRVIHVVDRRNPSLLWPALLEKAYLKVRGGYDFPGSNSCSDLWILTGWIPEQVYLQEAETVPSQLWNRIFKAYSYGDVLLTLGTGKMTTRQERDLGLEGQHSYAVLDLKETEEERLFLVKNPWAEGKGWRGPHPAVAAEMASSAEYADRNANMAKDTEYPTTFWIAFDQVIQHFESLYLNWNPGLFSRRQDIHAEWTIEKQHEVGNFILGNPQFSITTKSSGTVWLLLSRHFRDHAKQETGVSSAPSFGGPLEGYMSIVVCGGKGERLHMKDSVLECGPYVNTPQTLLRWEAEANSAYTIVIDQDDLPASTYSFTLSAFANSPILLEQAKSKYAFHEVVKGEWSKQTAGGTTDSSQYLDNPQYALEVRQTCSIAVLLKSINHSFPMHVKLAFGHGKRIVRLQGRDILTDSGDYRERAVFFEAHDVRPGHYTIICSLFEAGKTADFMLRVDSTGEFGLKQVPRDGAGLFLNKLATACFGPKVHKIAAPIYARKLAKYTIMARFLKMTAGNPQGPGRTGRSPLRFSVEVGTGPERKFIMSSEDGNYSDLPVVRSESFDLEAGAFGRGNTWLVLDRLYGPGGPVEEWIEVDVYTDTPKPCEIGVWREWD